jgi:hypothetical protein
MAQLSLGENRWRMVRRAIHLGRFRFEDCRNQTPQDRAHFDWLTENGFIVEVGDGWYELTEKGTDSADLGYYQFEPQRTLPPARPVKAASRTRRPSHKRV